MGAGLQKGGHVVEERALAVGVPLDHDAGPEPWCGLGRALELVRRAHAAG
jgi:hypothetical protein